MPFVKALIWVAAIIVIVIFAANNWVPVTIALWGDFLLDTKLPVPIIAGFLIGWLPLYLAYKSARWRFNKKIRSLQIQPGDLPHNYIPDPNPPAPEGAPNAASAADKTP